MALETAGHARGDAEVNQPILERESTKYQPMIIVEGRRKIAIWVAHVFCRLLRHDNQLFGVTLIPIAVSAWVNLFSNIKEQFVYARHSIYSTPLLALAVIFASAVYASTMAIILLTKARPRARYDTFWPNFLAAFGGFGVYLFGMLEPPQARLVGAGLPLLLLASGPAFALLSLFYLRRSFSVTPQADRLCQSGPYAIVRHPMYIGHILSLLGLALLFGTLQALVLSTALLLVQLRRAQFEERLLLSNFSDYRAYMSNTGSFFPRLRHLKMRKIALLLAMCALGFGAYSALRISPLLAAIPAATISTGCDPILPSGSPAGGCRNRSLFPASGFSNHLP
jgi:protein-S-isoprenylcysteine O-methyltransferase Ste14